MCSIYSLRNVRDLSYRFAAEDHEGIEAYERTYPGKMGAVVVRGDKNKIVPMQWGLIPYWAKDPKIGRKMFNARAGTLHEKPSFKEPLKRKRCLVPADGFYEWFDTGGKKIQCHFTLKDNSLFAFAGLYDTWKDPSGRIIHTYTIITTDPNDVVKPIHDRMPVILDKDKEDAWLDSSINSIDASIFLKPYYNDQLTVTEVHL